MFVCLWLFASAFFLSVGSSSSSGVNCTDGFDDVFASALNHWADGGNKVETQVSCVDSGGGWVGAWFNLTSSPPSFRFFLHASPTLFPSVLPLFRSICPNCSSRPIRLVATSSVRHAIVANHVGWRRSTKKRSSMELVSWLPTECPTTSTKCIAKATPKIPTTPVRNQSIWL